MKILWTFLTICLLSGVAASQTDKNVAAVRRAVETINKSAESLSKTSVKLDNLSTEGAEASIFREKNQIRKIVAQIYGELGSSIIELYYKDEKPIFIFEREYRYEKPFGKVLKIIPSRYYFADDKLLKMFIARREIYTDDKEYNEMRDRMTSLSKTIFDQVKDKTK